MVVAGDEETRVLLRGLLRLHRFRVVGEAEGTTATIERVREDPPDILVVDSQLAEGSVEDLLPEVRRRFPAVHVVLIVHGSPPSILEGRAAPHVVLRRPFRIQEFADALSPGSPPSL